MSPAELAAEAVIAEVVDEHEDRLDALAELNARLHPGYEDLDYLLDS